MELQGRKTAADYLCLGSDLVLHALVVGLEVGWGREVVVPHEQLHQSWHPTDQGRAVVKLSICCEEIWSCLTSQTASPRNARCTGFQRPLTDLPSKSGVLGRSILWRSAGERKLGLASTSLLASVYETTSRPFSA